MSAPDPIAGAQQRFGTGPWDAPDAIRFWGGPLSNFAPTPGLVLPAGWHEHPNLGERFTVATTEHFFAACKATSRRAFVGILAQPTAAKAKSAGRSITLRPDWEAVKFAVMLCALRGKYAQEPYRSVLLATRETPLVEWSPHDHEWGGAGPTGDGRGRNLLGLALMTVRAELRTQLADALRALGASPRDLAPLP